MAKKPVSEHLWALNILKGPKHCLYRQWSIFVIFVIALKESQLERFFLSIIWNLETVC